MRANARRNAEGALEVTPAASQDSSRMRSLAESNCLLVRPIQAPALPAGAPVPILMMDF
jgi:molybdopterin molybdotransferase